LAALCEINLAQVELLSGRADSALDRLLQLKGRLQDAPVDFARTLEFLGDAYFRLNLWPEAVDAYREALADRRTLIALHRAHLHLGLGQALRSAGKPAEAIEELRIARLRYSRLKNHAWGAAAITAHAQALLDQGKLRDARSLSRRAAVRAERAGANFHHAEALLTACSIDDDRALLGSADRIIRREGYLGLQWQVHHLQARMAPSAKRLVYYRRMFDAIQSGRLHVTSLSSRASYMRDKTRAVQDYLAELLNRGTTQSVAEAVGVIEQTRSVTLLDELLSARSEELNPQILERLQSLREELRELGGDDVNAGAARRTINAASPIASVQRRWIDLTRDLRAEVEVAIPNASAETVIFAQARNHLYAIADGVPHRLPISLSKLESELKWLQFELLAPMADRDADPAEALEIVQRLAKGLISPWEDGQTALCPDGALWRVPWSACVAVLDSQKETELRLHPSLGGNSGAVLPKSARVALWTSNAPDLPHAGIEAKQFLERFPNAEVFTSAEAVRREMEGEYDLIHVVAHAKHRASNPMFSAVSFPDGPLFATEIARACIKPDLVTLSACETGTMSVISRDEPDGLARGFLARGAKNVVASLWPLDDEAANRMFGTFFAYLSGGGSVAESLTRARSDARAWRAHPYFWGALALYGGYANT
jgi:tetratricopeptide (TPR) repeat protein